MRYDGIIFDLDGTLWNSTKEVLHTWTKVITARPELGRVPTYDEFMGVMGLSDKDLMKKLFPALTTEQGLELFNLCCNEENTYLKKHGAVGYEGVPEMLETLCKNYKLSIVSNCNTGYIECYMESMKTEKYFIDFESFGNTRRPKSENIKAVVQRNGFKNPVYIGDTAWDMDAALSVGVPFIHAAYGFGTVPANVPFAASPLDIIGIIERGN